MLGLRTTLKNVLLKCQNKNNIIRDITYKRSIPSYASFSKRSVDDSSNTNGGDQFINKSSNSENLGFRGNNNLMFDSRNGNNSNSYNNNNQQSRTDVSNINWEFEISNLPTIKKSLFELPTQQSEETIRFMAEHEISCKTEGVSLPTPIENLNEVPFHSKIKEILKSKFTTPTPVQSLGWLIALSGRDMLGVSKTGSGKTLSFILPAIEHILAQGRQPHYSGPSVLIVAPTRELANQIAKEAEPYLRAINIEIAAVYGGDSKERQQRILRRRPKIVVGTPGRIIDFNQDGVLSLKNVSFLVVDEADRLMEMGFEDSIESIFGAIRPDRQVLYWSATWPKKVSALANKYIKSPIHLQIGSGELTANKNITQKFRIVNSESDKVSALMDTLADIYTEDENAKTLIFTMTKRGADTLCDYIQSNGDNVRIDTLHGDKLQKTRERIVENFRNCYLDILVATDVASRGLDIKGINHVINFSLPHDCETYVHRIGRTARAGAKGISHSILSKNSMKDSELIKDLVNLLIRSDQQVPEEFSIYQTNNKGNNNYNRHNGNRSYGNNNRKPFSRNGNSGGGFRNNNNNGGGFRNNNNGGGNGYNKRSDF